MKDDIHDTDGTLATNLTARTGVGVFTSLAGWMQGSRLYAGPSHQQFFAAIYR